MSNEPQVNAYEMGVFRETIDHLNDYAKLIRAQSDEDYDYEDAALEVEHLAGDVERCLEGLNEELGYQAEEFAASIEHNLMCDVAHALGFDLRHTDAGWSITRRGGKVRFAANPVRAMAEAAEQ